MMTVIQTWFIQEIGRNKEYQTYFLEQSHTQQQLALL